ncbi:ACT domain-containing protein [Aquibium sp. ELW1220]|uniref:ACT domain-containing protein n=1 Tax=Aquibium sp. ELW1220 TaxID=2976766 RepID=UPI0025B009F3|nr:ACT domain-containing protein [Aquibium sp. ELW1220]MDN2580007.1 ACT domain-containing protein [Aquibium sp. ELW1220]
MQGESDLARLLAGLSPRLDETVYVFATLAAGSPAPAGLAPVMRFAEAEGTTLVLPRAEAERAGIGFTFPCRRIVLEIHSSLEAVGFLAAILPRLAAAGIGVNPVSAFHHDHLFVPEARAADAMAILEALALGT